jgi:UDP-N-acetylmuramate dehydrogenase
VRLSDFTTLRLGGPASTFVEAATEAAFISALSAADEAGESVLILGGGSNLVVSDAGFDGTVIKVATSGITPVETDGGVLVTVAAGENWDDFVAHAVSAGWVGVEALAGIPGTVGATPMQNVGAYGQEVGQTVAEVRVWDRTLKGVRTFTAADCGFGYRWSRFKADPGRHAILAVTFQFETGTLSAPVAYAELARTLGVEVGERAPLIEVREAVLGLRRGKGMVLDAEDHDTWSAGSFFTNPFVAQAPEGAPAYPQPDGRVKTSAAWLIEQAGFHKGFGNDLVSLSTKHTLALTNRGGASTDDLLALAREVRDGVRAKFGIELEPEPIFLGCSL